MVYWKYHRFSTGRDDWETNTVVWLCMKEPKVVEKCDAVTIFVHGKELSSLKTEQLKAELDKRGIGKNWK